MRSSIKNRAHCGSRARLYFVPLLTGFISQRAIDEMREVLAKFFHIASYRRAVRGESFRDSQTDACGFNLADCTTVNTCSRVRFCSGAMRTATGTVGGGGQGGKAVAWERKSERIMSRAGRAGKGSDYTGG